MVFDEFVRVYFGAKSSADDGKCVLRTAFVDLDRRRLTNVVHVSAEPVLPLGRLGEFDEFGAGPVSVVEHNQGWRAYYTGWTRCESVPYNTGIGVASSLDGLTFTREGRGPVLPFTPHEPFLLGDPNVQHVDELWYLFYTTGRVWTTVAGEAWPVRRIRLATSNDGLVWVKHGGDLIASELDPDETQTGPSVCRANGAYHLFFSHRSIGDRAETGHGWEVGYARSVDLVRWDRGDAGARFGASRGGWDWDFQSVREPHVFNVDGRTYMVYVGARAGRQTLGLAELDGELL
jgi:predicted GH43/DUF377 family glycosyl hydrolase